ncbi:bifunctional chorismate-binding protein/class IV aminotransferase [Sphaerotilus mobilis]|uniref:Para-aminobenzoate synthetase/4-amino-4-deoxychorismate lyase n=1 Tax=Sphaerotilus mobilis TaxID=47994 RepID=A0A4Q7LVJ8_9BURK|nr:bifunctional chorismate-binding protein/class IV aminotransferase [Sphaerotilus mobilis]RZS57978.1 para-aminobenzoate synthetase/4-amino-4-deoxychorismate lyase [Sphaerotilus mobilis]
MSPDDPTRAPVFALLDDAHATAASPSSRLCTGFLRELRCDDPATLEATCAALTHALAEGAHAIVLADYEWGVRLQFADSAHAAPAQGGAFSVLLFERCEHLDADGVSRWLDAHAPDTPAGFSRWQGERANVRGDDTFGAPYLAAIEQIHAWIRAGETYQVNHTVRLAAQAWGDPRALYRRLRQRQPVPYGALMHRPDGRWVLSCSPELFVRHDLRDLHDLHDKADEHGKTGHGPVGILTAKPMKGTAARQPDPLADAWSPERLQSDPKNRAENLMIVDLLRNDLGRIARTGTVRVPKLFEIEPYRTVWQMTSTIEAELPPTTGLAEVLRALFPCGSITGAPKRHTMELIHRIEPQPRGLYCGAIGWVDAAPAGSGLAVGPFCLNVAIRTLTLDPPVSPDDGGRRPATLGVGAGIVLDSIATAEADEVQLKARFVTAFDPGFTLFETLRAEDGRLLRLDAHLARLARSAGQLGFTLDADDVRARLLATLRDLPRTPHRVRLDLSADGGVTLRHAPLAPLKAAARRVLLSTQQVPPTEAGLLGHKTSRRAAYDAAMHDAELAGAFDLLFVDADGQLSEGSRSNVFIRLDGRWLTPPARGQLLPGVMRAAVLAGEPGCVLSPLPVEREISRADLMRAEAVAVCNSLRGLMLVRVDTQGLGA